MGSDSPLTAQGPDLNGLSSGRSRAEPCSSHPSVPSSPGPAISRPGLPAAHQREREEAWVRGASLEMRLPQGRLLAALPSSLKAIFHLERT